MTFLKSKKRLGQFETLETKKLFAADLAASADVLSINPVDCTSAVTAEIVDPSDTPSLGGQEGEPVSGPATDIVLTNLGGQEREDVADRGTENFRSIIHKSGPRPDSGDSYEEIKWT